jgi:hypothetical protein
MAGQKNFWLWMVAALLAVALLLGVLRWTSRQLSVVQAKSAPESPLIQIPTLNNSA